VLKVIERMVGKTDDVAALEAQIAAEKDKAIQAHAELERLEEAYQKAPDYEAATALDHAIAQQRWTIRHADNVIPELESRLAAARAERQRQAIERHWSAARNLYPKLKTALLEAANLQARVIEARNAAIAELGDWTVERHLPRVSYIGLLFHDLIEIWSKELDRSFQTSPNQKPAMTAPKPVEKPAVPLIDFSIKATAESHPPPGEAAAAKPRPQKRPLLKASPPGEGERQVTMLRGTVELRLPGELPDRVLLSMIGDRVNLDPIQARDLVLAGAAEFVNEFPPAETGGDAA